MSNNINNRNERNLRRPQVASALNDRATNNQNATELWLEKIRLEPKIKHSAKKRSWIWAYFTEDEIYNLVKCNRCDQLLHYTSPTSEMITHLQLEHEINEKSTNVLKQNAVKRTISDLNEEDECILLENEVQPESNEDGQKSAKRQKKLIDALVDFIIKTDTPISIVENDDFKQLLNLICPI